MGLFAEADYARISYDPLQRLEIREVVVGVEWRKTNWGCIRP
jgi:hypothetical protein